VHAMLPLGSGDGDRRRNKKTFTSTLLRVDVAERAGVNTAASVHWLRHAHACHAIDNGAPITLVPATLGHADLKTTSVYHARPGESSGRYLKTKQGGSDPGRPAPRAAEVFGTAMPINVGLAASCRICLRSR